MIALWWRSTPRPTDTGALITAAGDVLGLLAGYGFVVLVALMARLPPLEKGIGTDRLARWHAMGGRYVITLVSGHVPLIVWGYAVSAHVKVTSEAATLLTTYPDVLMATVAWFLLLGVAAFSARAARRRLVVRDLVLRAPVHLPGDRAGVQPPVRRRPRVPLGPHARVAWSALYATVAALIVWYRVDHPAAQRRPAPVHRAVRPAGGARHRVGLHHRPQSRPAAGASPGSSSGGGSSPASCGGSRTRTRCRRCRRPIRCGSRSRPTATTAARWPAWRPGTRVFAEGPYGAFTPALTGRRVLFIAGGVGITPIRAMFAALPRRMSGGIILLYRASHPRDVVFSRELNAIATDRQAALRYLIGSRDELGYDPLGTENLQQAIPGLHRYEAYVCGPPGMTQTAVTALRAAGIPSRRIHHESFDF